MPATPFNETALKVAAIVIQSLVALDATVGTQYGMEGVLVNNAIQVKPARERKAHKNHHDLEVIALNTNPMITLSFDCRVTQLAGPFSAKHPGTVFSVAAIQNYYPGVAHGFPTDSGNWFELMNPDFSSPPGDLFTTKFELRLWCPAYLTGGTYVYGNIT